jgi:TRAP-type C4-dicarboxylate transport system permease small subunit
MIGIRKWLHNLFISCGYIAAGFLIAILVLIIVQVVGRLVGFSTPGITNYAGYCMAGASFFGLSYAMHINSHIRVSLFLNLSNKFRFILELWCHLIATGLCIYFSFYSGKMIYWSHKFHDVSQGQDATALWIPQLVSVLGTAVLALVLLERTYLLIFKPQDPLSPVYSSTDQA